jgi:hypothetical protein
MVMTCANSTKDNRIMQISVILSLMAGPNFLYLSFSIRRNTQLSNEDKIS